MTLKSCFSRESFLENLGETYEDRMAIHFPLKKKIDFEEKKKVHLSFVE
jgi:hypothetical protein